MEENYETILVLVESILEGDDAASIYSSIYETVRRLVDKLVDLNFLYCELYEEFAYKNSMRGEKFTIPEGYECPVCYVEYKDDTYFRLGCTHMLCAKCFASLLMNNHDRCPMCRQDITLGDCKINKTFETPPFTIPEHEIEDITADYVNDYIFNIHNSSLW